MIDKYAEEDATSQFGRTPAHGTCCLCGDLRWLQDQERGICSECYQVVIPACVIRSWGEEWKGEPAARVYATLLALQRRLDALLEKP